MVRQSYLEEDKMNSKGIFFYGILFSIFQVILNSPASAQWSDSIPLHDFFNKQREPLITGKVLSISRSEVEIENGLGEKFKLSINSLSKNNQEFIRSIKRSYDYFLRTQKESNRLIERLNPNSSKSTVLRAMTKLANYNLAAQTHTEWIANLLIKTEDLDAKLAALNAFVSICPKNEKSYQFLEKTLLEDKRLLMTLNDQGDFFIGKIGRFGSTGHPVNKVLIHATNTGELRFDFSKTKVEKSSIPLKVKSKKHNIHLAALASLCKQKLGGDAAATVFGAIKFAERSLNGSIDHLTIYTAYSAFALDGKLLAGEYSTFMNKYKKKYPTEGEQWIRNAKSMTVQDLNIDRRSRMRRFNDRAGNFLVFAEIESTRDGQVVLTNHLMKRISVSLAKFSDSDQVWLEQNATR